jgi:monoamine oxidase
MGKGPQHFDYIAVEGGYGRLVEKLKEKLGLRIHLGMPLKTLTKTLRNSYILKFGNGQEVEAEQVVLALPCRVYQDISFEGDEGLSSRLSDIKGIGYGEHAKLVVPVNIPKDVYGFYASDRFVLFSMGTPNIATFYYLNNSVSFVPSTLQDVFKRDQGFLEAIYGDISIAQLQPQYARCEQFASYQQPVGYNWCDDPYSRGSYSCLAAGQEGIFTDTIDYKGEKVKKLFSPINDRLFFAGEHASILMGVMGTMEAAVEAGERTARIMVTIT